MTYGTYQRTVPRVNVVRGYMGNETSAMTRSAKPTVNAGIMSGMLISLVGGQWVKGCAAASEPYIAFHDQTDTDVVSSGLLLGLSCAGQYEIETGWFDNTVVYLEGSALIAGATAGQIGLKVAADGKDTIGFASRGGRQDVTKTNSMAAPTGGSLLVLSFRTRWQPIVSAT